MILWRRYTDGGLGWYVWKGSLIWRCFSLFCVMLVKRYPTTDCACAARWTYRRRDPELEGLAKEFWGGLGLHCVSLNNRCANITMYYNTLTLAIVTTHTLSSRHSRSSKRRRAVLADPASDGLALIFVGVRSSGSLLLRRRPWVIPSVYREYY